MGSNTGNRSTSPRKNGNPLLAGILVGLVLGVCIASGLAWYLMKSPSPFLPKDLLRDMKPIADVEQPTPAPDASTDSGKPRFEFYKVLTDKQDKAIVTPARPAEKPKGTDSNPVVAFEPHLLQVGSFPKAEDAEKLKAKLALLGAEANIQTATIPDKGVWYRVRLGPYKTAEEMDRDRSFLQLNGVGSTPMRAQ
ncbi:MAG: SPOR domain-containing protein [Gallionella sp.]